MEAASIITKTLFRWGSGTQRLWELLKWRYSTLALMARKQLAALKDNHCWYALTIRHFLHTLEDEFIVRLTHRDIHLSHVLHSVIGFLQTSLHQLEIEVGRYSHTHLRKKEFANYVRREWNLKNTMFPLYHFYEVRGRYNYLFNQSFGPLRKVNGIWGPPTLGSVLARIQETKRSCWRTTI